MKKLFALLLTLTMVLSLAACGGSKDDASKDEVQEPVDLLSFYEGLTVIHNDQGPAQMALEGEMLDTFYAGLSDIATKQCYVYTPPMEQVVCEVALVEVENAEDVDAVKEIFQARIDERIESGAWYPTTVEIWENNAHIVSNGNNVMLVAFSEADAIVEAFEALFA